MNWQTHMQTYEFADGRTLSIETGKLARQADGSILLRMGKAAMLATVVSAKKPREGANFFPLSVDYQEKFAGAGRIPGSFGRREGRLSNHEILISRLIDRALRPLFPDGYRNDTQVIISLISADPEVLPDALAGLAASAALTISDVPMQCPISEVRVARIGGEYVVNPTASALAEADIDIILAATEDDIMMVEGEAHECSEEELVEAIKVGHVVIKEHCAMQRALAAQCGKAKRAVELPVVNEEAKAVAASFAKDKIYTIARSGSEKHERSADFDVLKQELVESLGEEAEADFISAVKESFDKLKKEVIRSMILDERIRLDGRTLNEVRELNIEIGLFESPHGCSLFCRGETQSLTTVTLGSKQQELLVDRALGVEFDKFFLHYNFPPFSTGETKPLRTPGRREIGHGHLAQRSLERVLPSIENNPYTIRIVSDILESNGSSSMATVCAGSLALMDAGVQIRTGVSGIAMGLISDGERVAVLSDILGDEDHLGDMDFKVTGTSAGICAVQMDMKIDGLPYEVLIAALHQAKEGRLHILNQMNEVISEPRPEPKPHAPRITKMYIPKEFIGAVIGPGGKVIQEIQEVTGTTIHIEENELNQGVVSISCSSKEGMEQAIERIKGITSVPEIGDVYDAKVKSVMPYGAFVEFLPGKEGLLHISEIEWHRIESMDGVLTEGQVIQVKLIDVDKRSGKFKLSRKVLLPNPNPGSGNDRGDRNDRGGDRDRNDRGDNRRNNSRPPRR
jgi:polyribonucleotide nucleotidyltransferase